MKKWLWHAQSMHHFCVRYGDREAINGQYFDVNCDLHYSQSLNLRNIGIVRLWSNYDWILTELQSKSDRIGVASDCGAGDRNRVEFWPQSGRNLSLILPVFMFDQR